MNATRKQFAARPRTKRAALRVAALFLLASLLAPAAPAQKAGASPAAKRAAAQKALEEGERLFNKAVEEDEKEASELSDEEQAKLVQDAFSNWEKAGRLFHELGDKKSEAKALGYLGYAFSNLASADNKAAGEKALAYLNEALALVRATADKGAEADLLGVISDTYYNLGDKKKSEEYQQQSDRLRKKP